MSPHTSLIALINDVENIPSKLIQSILTKIQEIGEIAECFISGKETSLRTWRGGIKDYSFRKVIAPSGKDMADYILISECVDIVYKRPEIDTFCIVSNDARFAPICHLLLSLGKRVFVMGTSHAAKILQKNFEFILLEASADISPQTAKLQQLLETAFIELNQEWVTLARLGETLLKLDKSFKSKAYSKATLSKLLQTLTEFIELRKEQSQYSARLKKPSTKTNHQKLSTKN